MATRTRPPTHRLLLPSLAALTAVVVIALAGLALDRNWSKLLRIAVAFATYAGVLLALQRRGDSSASRASSLPLPWFILAAAAAGLVSGLARPHFHAGVLLVGTLFAPLLGVVHWAALRALRAMVPPVPGSHADDA